MVAYMRTAGGTRVAVAGSHNIQRDIHHHQWPGGAAAAQQLHTHPVQVRLTMIEKLIGKGIEFPCRLAS